MRNPVTVAKEKAHGAWEASKGKIAAGALAAAGGALAYHKMKEGDGSSPKISHSDNNDKPKKVKIKLTGSGNAGVEGHGSTTAKRLGTAGGSSSRNFMNVTDFTA